MSTLRAAWPTHRVKPSAPKLLVMTANIASGAAAQMKILHIVFASVLYVCLRLCVFVAVFVH